MKNNATWSAAGPTRHVSTSHLTSPPAPMTRSLSSKRLATCSWECWRTKKLSRTLIILQTWPQRQELTISNYTLLRATGLPALHKIILQSPALATKSVFLNIRETNAVQPGCQSFLTTPFDLRHVSSSSLKVASVLMKACTSVSAGLQKCRSQMSRIIQERRSQKIRKKTCR